MPLHFSPIIYEPEIEEITEEKEIVWLLNDIRSNLKDIPEFGKKNPTISLQETLNIVEKGLCSLGYLMMEGVLSVVDLSQARRLVDSYRALSEGQGCGSCKFYGEVRGKEPFEDEFWYFCEYHEEESDIDAKEGIAPVLSCNFDIGCEQKEPKLRKLEDVLAEA